jgi:hypothetical protein
MWVAVSAQAGPRFEITPLAGYRAFGHFDLDESGPNNGDSVDLDEDSMWGVDLALYRDEESFYELFYTRQETAFKAGEPGLGGVDVSTEYWQLGGTLLFPHQRWLVPWLSVTVGVTRFDADVPTYDDEVKFSGSLGLGLRVPFAEHVDGNLGVRGYMTWLDSDSDLLCTGSGGVDCLVRADGSFFYQAEVFAGLSFSF